MRGSTSSGRFETSSWTSSSSTHGHVVRSSPCAARFTLLRTPDPVVAVARARYGLQEACHNLSEKSTDGFFDLARWLSQRRQELTFLPLLSLLTIRYGP